MNCMWCSQLICQVALISGSNDELLLLAWRYIASAQNGGRILAMATHMCNQCIVSFQPLPSNSDCIQAFHSTVCHSQRRQEAPLCPTRKLAWTPTFPQCGFYCSYSLLLFTDHYTLYRILVPRDDNLLLVCDHCTWTACCTISGQVNMLRHVCRLQSLSSCPSQPGSQGT